MLLDEIHREYQRLGMLGEVPPTPGLILAGLLGQETEQLTPERLDLMRGLGLR